MPSDSHRHLGVQAHTCVIPHSGGRIRTSESSRLPWSSSKTPPLPIEKRRIRTYTVVPNETIPWFLLKLHFPSGAISMTSTHLPSVGESNRARKGTELWLRSFLIPQWCHPDLVPTAMHQPHSLHFWRENWVHEEVQTQRQLWGYNAYWLCISASLITSKSPPQTHE